MSATASIDKEALVPLSLIRTHTVTTDIEYVTDEQLAFYRDVAFELAEQFADLNLTSSGYIEQFVSYPEAEIVTVPLDGPVTDGIVNVSFAGVPFTMVVPVGATSIRVGRGVLGEDGRPVCYNMNAATVGQGMTLRFKSDQCGKALPASIKLGILQFIAWALSHPGDCAVDGKSARASGAMATWRASRKNFAF